MSSSPCPLHFSIKVIDSIRDAKYQFELPIEVVRGFGLSGGGTFRIADTINPRSSYWVTFRYRNGAWRSTGSAWDELTYRHKIKEGETLWFERQSNPGLYYVLRLDRLHEIHERRGFMLDDLFKPPPSSEEDEYTSSSTETEDFDQETKEDSDEESDEEVNEDSEKDPVGDVGSETETVIGGADLVGNSGSEGGRSTGSADIGGDVVSKAGVATGSADVGGNDGGEDEPATGGDE